jgi:hypothetical protein
MLWNACTPTLYWPTAWEPAPCENEAQEGCIENLPEPVWDHNVGAVG